MAALNRYYYPIKYSSRTQAIAAGVKCVFISYQKQDKESAKKVAEYLQVAGIDIYFDEYDKELKIHHQSDNPKEVTKSICNGINNSSHMVVIISPNTIASTWVPFEIGYGFDKTDLGILCLKGIPKGALPEYIRTAKIIRDILDLNTLLVSLSGKSREVLLEAHQLSEFGDYNHPLLNVMDRLVSDQYK